jgi:hypothetical protein
MTSEADRRRAKWDRINFWVPMATGVLGVALSLLALSMQFGWV